MKRPVEVVTSHPDTNVLYLKKIIDWSNQSDKTWFSRHHHWAIVNNYRVQSTPIRNSIVGA